jgi:hypothetical protein
MVPGHHSLEGRPRGMVIGYDSLEPTGDVTGHDSLESRPVGEVIGDDSRGPGRASCPRDLPRRLIAWHRRLGGMLQGTGPGEGGALGILVGVI